MFSKKFGKRRDLKANLLFVVTLAFAFYAVDQLYFDGQYTKNIWTQGNHYGELWQRDVKLWIKRSF